MNEEENPVAIAIDIGGTKTGLAVFSSETGLLANTTIATQPEKGCEMLIAHLYERSLTLLESCNLSPGRVTGIGIVSPGPLDFTNGKIIHAPMLGWKNTPLVRIAGDIFRKEVALQGDTAGAALGEYIYGCGGSRPDSLIYITVSTGVSCGIVIDGNIYNGAFGAAGELGHLKIATSDVKCPCGGSGCLETIASGTGIARIAKELTGEDISAKKVFELAACGEPVFVNIVEQAGHALGVGVATLMQLLDPEVIIFGGSVSKDFEQMRPYIEKVLAMQVQNFAGRKTVIRKSALPNGFNTLLGAGYMSVTRLLGTHYYNDFSN